MFSVLTHSSISSCCSLITIQHSGIQFVSRYLTVVSFDIFTCKTKSSRVSGIASRKPSMSNKRTAKYLEEISVQHYRFKIPQRREEEQPLKLTLRGGHGHEMLATAIQVWVYIV